MQRCAIAALLSVAVVGDAAFGALQPGTVRPALLSLAVVVGVGLFAGARVGMTSGFVAGVLLDLLSDPASVAGVHTLTMLLTGTLAGYGRRHPRHGSTAVAAAVGGLMVCGAAVLSIVLQGMLGAAVAHAFGPVITQSVVVGSIVSPLAHRALRRRVVRPLSEIPPAA
jgi:rod shape-determining protein MreD